MSLKKREAGAKKKAWIKKKTPSGEGTDLQRHQKYTKVQYIRLRQLINTCE